MEELKDLQIEKNMLEEENNNNEIIETNLGTNINLKNRHFVLTEGLIKFRRYKGNLVEQNNTYGNFYGKTPYEAARKASHSIFESKIFEGLNLDETIEFSMREITRDSKNKIYKYKVKRELLKEPVKIIMKNGGEYYVNFKNTIKRI